MPRNLYQNDFVASGLEELNNFMVVTGSGGELHDLRHMEEIARQGLYRRDVF